MKPYGFQIYPKGSRYFVRVKSHYVQAVYQEVLCGGTTSFQMIVTPAFTYQKAWFFSGDDIVDYFEQLDFEKYQILCEKRRDEVLRYCSSGDSLRFYAAGYNNIWQKNYDNAEVYLAKGISEAQCVIQKREEVNYPQNPDFNKDLYAAREIMLILQKKETGWEKLLEEKLSFLERDALEKVWGITLISGDSL